MPHSDPILTQPFCTGQTGGVRAPDIAHSAAADAWLEAAARVMPLVPFAQLWHEAGVIASERGAAVLERAHCESALSRLVAQQPYPFEAAAANPSGLLDKQACLRQRREAVATPTSGTGLPLVCEVAS